METALMTSFIYEVLSWGLEHGFLVGAIFDILLIYFRSVALRKRYI